MEKINVFGKVDGYKTYALVLLGIVFTILNGYDLIPGDSYEIIMALLGLGTIGTLRHAINKA
ncbi:MAG: hypothetical protein HN402_07790 [Candidatus Scalindua sp.]|jgi:hypothetical protein|nr:hypothetical protein [Candidatus Scalindua sp.]MBT6757343.1 hypothetical protein [Candidatus Jacksonbacteria bacterium]